MLSILMSHIEVVLSSQLSTTIYIHLQMYTLDTLPLNPINNINTIYNYLQQHFMANINQRECGIACQRSVLTAWDHSTTSVSLSLGTSHLLPSFTASFPAFRFGHLSSFTYTPFLFVAESPLKADVPAHTQTSRCLIRLPVWDRGAGSTGESTAESTNREQTGTDWTAWWQNV